MPMLQLHSYILESVNSQYVHDLWIFQYYYTHNSSTLKNITDNFTIPLKPPKFRILHNKQSTNSIG